VVGQAGLLALGPGVDAGKLKRWIREAREFAAEWGELRAVHQNHLAGNPLRCPLLVRQEGHPSTGEPLIPTHFSLMMGEHKARGHTSRAMVSSLPCAGPNSVIADPRMSDEHFRHCEDTSYGMCYKFSHYLLIKLSHVLFVGVGGRC
jgi:hypothetical protein